MGFSIPEESNKTEFYKSELLLFFAVYCKNVKRGVFKDWT